jgi:hypothetical protein
MDDFAPARKALRFVDPEASDEVIAQAIAEYLLSAPPRSRIYCLGIAHDVRPYTLPQTERLREFGVTYPESDPLRPCPVPFDWSRENTVGIETRDLERARRWVIDAAIAGYCVFRNWSGYGGGFGQGIAETRERRREEIQREAYLGRRLKHDVATLT